MEGVGEVHRARRLSVAALLALTLVALSGAPSLAQESPDGNAGTEFDTSDDGVGTTVSSPGDATNGSGGGASAHSCWFKLDADADGNPKWPFVDATGKILFAWFYLYCDGELVDPAPRLLAVNGGGATPAARTLAEEAFRFLPLPAPSVRFNPSPAITGLSTWWWIDGSSWGPRTIEVGVTGLSVTLRATPESVTWSPGDGAASISCEGPGVPYDTARPASAQRTDCAHTYRRSSAGETGGVYAASATTRWRIAWRATDGTSGALAALDRTTTFDVGVEQIRTVVTSRN